MCPDCGPEQCACGFLQMITTCPFCNGLVPGHATGSADICECEPIQTSETIAAALEIGRKWQKDSSLAAWFPISVEHLKQALELYEKAQDEPCECYSNPDGGCPFCERIAKARRLAEGVIGEYEQH